jgi:hypothetical protein
MDTRPENESMLGGFKHNVKLSIGEGQRCLPIAMVVIVER